MNHMPDTKTPRTDNLVDLLMDRALKAGHKRAYIFLKDGEKEAGHLTYGQLDLQARAIAARLRTLGAVGQRVLLMCPPGLEYIAAFFGSLYAGAVAVPVYPPHPARLKKTLPRLKGIIKSAQPAIALTTSKIFTLGRLMFKIDSDLRKMKWESIERAAKTPASDWQKPEVKGRNIAFLQYTSGSTGAPKGVMVSHGSLIANIELIYRHSGLNADTVGISWLPPYHDMGLIGFILVPLYGMIPEVIMSPIAFLQKPMRWLRAIAKYGGTASGGPDFAYDLCVRKAKQEDIEALDLRSWQVAYNGAEPIRSETMERFSATFTSCGFRKSAFYPCYGLAEGTLMVSGGKVNELPVVRRFRIDDLERNQAVTGSDHDQNCRWLIGCGKTLDGQDIRIVDPKTGIECDQGRVGEIWVSGPSVTQGYWQMPEETVSSFNAHLSDTRQGPFLRTGDLGFLFDRELFVTGRLKDMLIIRGRNHYAHDIELTAQKSYSLVRPGCCAAFVAEIDGQDRLVIVAEVERRYKDRRGLVDQPSTDKNERSWQERRQYLELPDFTDEADQRLIPQNAYQSIREAVADEHGLQVYAIELIKVGSIPKTSSGKIRRHACRQRFLEKSLETISGTIFSAADTDWIQADFDIDSFAAASERQRKTMVERYFLAVLAKTLKIDETSPDMNAPLGSFGFDSVMAIELQHRIEIDLGIELPMTVFLETPKIASLVCLLSEKLNKRIRQSDTRIIESALDEALPEKGKFPLSYNQKSLWFLYKLAPDSSAYNVFFPVKIIGEVNVTALENAFSQLVQRHGALRTTYGQSADEPVQSVHTELSVRIKIENVTSLSSQQIQNRLIEDACRPFDLEAGPLLRLTLYVSDHPEREKIFLLNIHHIAVDLWSFSILLDELKTLYRHQCGVASGAIPGTDGVALPELTADYRHFVNRQNEMLTGKNADFLWEYWKQKLSGDLPVSVLPTDFPRPAVQTYNGASHVFDIDTALTRRLKLLAADMNVTPYMLLLAAFKVLLKRYTGQDDIIVGSPVAGRSKADFNPVVGFFSNTLALRTDLGGNPTFKTLLKRVRETVLGGLLHQDYPFALLIERIKPDRDPGRSPVFQIMFVLEKPHLVMESAPFVLKEQGAEMNLGGLQIESMPLEQRSSQFDLTLMMVESDGRMIGSMEYNTDLFLRETISRMADHFQTLLRGIADNPDLSVADLPIMTEPEREMVIRKWNRLDAWQTDFTTVMEMFEKRVSRDSDRIGVVFSPEKRSYAQLDSETSRVANYLRDHYNIQPDDRVGSLLDRSHWVVIGLMGILKAGGAFVPIDPEYPEKRIRFMITDSNCKVVLTEQKYMDMLSRFYDRKRIVDIQKIEHSDTSTPHVRISPENLSYVIYTSGSTGVPKGVMQTHRCLSNLIQWQIASTGAGWRILQYAALGFDVFVQETLYSLISGSVLFVIPVQLRYDMVRLSEFLVEKRIEMLTMPFTPLNLLFRDGQLHRQTRTCLRHIITSGEALTVFPELGDYLRRHPKVSLHNQYGPTETHVVTAHTMSTKSGNIELQPPIGAPISNTEILILDAFMNPSPIGIAGEIFAGGHCLARGYLNNDIMTSEKFIDHPYREGEKLYRTGDIGYWSSDGAIRFCGRNDEQVKIRGHRIELGEIEGRLHGHPKIREAVVAAKPFRQSGLELVAYIKSDGKISIAELRNDLTGDLPGYMIPSHFIFMDEFDYTASGKIEKKNLPVPDEAGMVSTNEYQAPETELEKKLVAIWQEVLGLENAGIRDNFFESGGHSLKAMQLVSRISRETGCHISLGEIFTHPTLKELADVIQRADQKIYDPITPVDAIEPASEQEIAALKKLLKDDE